MSIVKNILVRLPGSIQDHIVTKAMEKGAIFTTPVFSMLLRTLEFYGGNIKEIKETLKKVNRDNSILDIIDKAGDIKIQEGNNYLTCGEKLRAKNSYFQAFTYFFLLEYFNKNLSKSHLYYKKYMPVFEKFSVLTNPPIEKIDLPYKNGVIKAQYRIPNGDGPFPAVIFIQGNEGSKEHMVKFEEYALKKGMATLSVDPPGYGETMLSGVLWESEDDYRAGINKSVDFLMSNSSINNIGIFGVSGGGLLSSYSATLDKRISASAGLGSTSPYTFVKSWKYALVSQKRKSFRYTGTSNLKDCYKWMLRCQSDIINSLPKLDCPSLWVNGSDDLLVPIDDIKKITDELGEKAEFRPIQGGDHLCSQFLEKGLADDIFNWFAEKLK